MVKLSPCDLVVRVWVTKTLLQCRIKLRIINLSPKLCISKNFVHWVVIFFTFFQIGYPIILLCISAQFVKFSVPYPFCQFQGKEVNLKIHAVFIETMPNISLYVEELLHEQQTILTQRLLEKKKLMNNALRLQLEQQSYCFKNTILVGLTIMIWEREIGARYF